jgi:hypothetical protein
VAKYFSELKKDNNPHSETALQKAKRINKNDFHI